MNMLTSIVLVFATLTIALGLGAITTSLALTSKASESPVQDRPPVVGAVDGTLEVGSPGSRHAGAQPRAVPEHLVSAPARSSLGRASATGPWVSSLYPQNGVTLWDRIRVSSRKDRRAYLLGSAIQVHAPATAAIPTAHEDSHDIAHDQR